MEKDNLKLVIALARTYNHVFSELDKNIKSFGLNQSEFGVLEMLLHKGEVPVQQIAEKILVTSGTITYVIDKLCKKGLVTRRKCDIDQRKTFISLTENGQSLITDSFEKHKKYQSNLFKSVGDSEKKQLIQFLNYLDENI